jgi:hypothetical protein
VRVKLSEVVSESELIESATHTQFVGTKDSDNYATPIPYTVVRELCSFLYIDLNAEPLKVKWSGGRGMTISSE